MKLLAILEKFLLLVICAALLTGSAMRPLTVTEKAEEIVRNVEFDYVGWTLSAFGEKMSESGIAAPQHLSQQSQTQAVERYFALVYQLDVVEGQIQQIYSNPTITDPKTASTDLLKSQNDLQNELNGLAPVVESILQSQVTQVLGENGLTVGGSTIPPVLYRTTPLPKALIISPRDKIYEEANISLLADLPLDKITVLEQTIEKNLDVSALVVDIGGVGIYPTMVEQSSDLSWVANTVAHEWTHNFLTLHPLGLNYDKNDQLRTMNETTASIVGDEISAIILSRYYPNWKAQTLPVTGGTMTLASTNAPADTFNFQQEMHTTRVNVDQMLAEGKITQAEQYMEAQRQIFVAHGYMIRRLNQAYFAFYGAYADTPVGAQGADPVGPAVRALREKAGSLANFLEEIARMNSFDQLQKAVQ